MPTNDSTHNPMLAGGLVQSGGSAGGASSPVGVSARLVTGPNNKKVLLLEVARHLSLSTAAAVGAAVDLEVDLGQFEWMGPMIDRIIAHTNTVNRTTGFSWRMRYWTSYDGKTWSGPNNVFSDVSTSGYAIQTPLSPAAGFPLRMRFAFTYFSTSGNLESAAVSATFAIELAS